MSIRPMDFNGMIQNTHELSQSKIHENDRPVMQQAQLTVEVDKREELRRHQVNEKDNADGTQYRYDREGNGKGYGGNQGQRSSDRNNKEKKNEGVFIKGSTSTFDIKI